MTFTFNGEFYIQTEGVEIGSPLAPILANSYFSKIEKTRIFSQKFPFKFKFYYRFVDDVVFIFDQYYDKNLILDYFNNIDKQNLQLN